MLRENELTKKYFPFLDGLRAVAILWVILHHLPIALPGWLNEIRIRGDLGVELFFSISSFLVFRSLHQCMLKNNEDKFEFLKRRLFRIFPPYFFTLGLIWIMALFDKGLSSKISSIKDIALSFPFFYYNYAITHTAGNVPGSLNIFWSLSFEEQFYMALFLLTYLMPRRISIFVMAGILISISLRLLKFFLHIPMMPVELQMQTHLRLDAILLGCFFYYYWVYLKKYFNFLALNSVLILITIFLHSFLNYRYQGLLYILISLSFTAFVFNMLKKDKGLLITIFQNKILTQIGVVSFEIYLLHEIFIGLAVRIGLKNYPFTFVTFSYIASILGAFVLHRYFSNPTNKFLRKKYITNT